MSLAQALFMGLLQGATELFPVSSLGHAVLIPSLLHWSFKQSDPSFVPFLVLLHLGTAGALLFIYRSQWVDIIKSFFKAALRGRIAVKEDTQAHEEDHELTNARNEEPVAAARRRRVRRPADEGRTLA